MTKTALPAKNNDIKQTNNILSAACFKYIDPGYDYKI